MIKHVVCHKYNDKNEALKIKPMLMDLVGKVPGLKNMEVGIDFMDTARAYHLVLIATFDDRAGLDVYADHPEHVKVKDYIHTVLESGISVDYEI
ncbi:MAG: Dabb family protein [Clostridia bacterium]|nr:Dabb family protein [Clostridia bacterium]